MRGKRSSSSAAAESAQVKRARWAKRVETWERSGLSQRAWCKAEGVSLSTFQWWRQRLAQEVPSESVPSFMPLRLEPEATTASIEVRLRSGTQTRIEGEEAGHEHVDGPDAQAPVEPPAPALPANTLPVSS